MVYQHDCGVVILTFFSNMDSYCCQYGRQMLRNLNPENVLINKLPVTIISNVFRRLAQGFITRK